MIHITDLYTWYAFEYHPDESLVWASSFWDHVRFIRNTLEDMFKTKGKVVGTHVSKSIINPVVKFNYKDVEILLQYNFYNWQIMVKSPRPLKIEGLKELKPTNYLYYQGIPEEYIFKAYSPTNKKKFAISLDDTLENCYAFLILLKLAINKSLKEGGN